jgi:hypothetical protein
MRRLAPLLLLAACASSSGKATLEVDGAWVRTFPTDREGAFHTAMAALAEEGYTVVTANPLGGSFVANSEIEKSSLWVRYTFAHVVVEPSPQAGMRIRLSLTRTSEPAGAGRRPNNDRAVTDRARYEAIFDAIEKILEA